MKRLFLLFLVSFLLVGCGPSDIQRQQIEKCMVVEVAPTTEVGKLYRMQTCSQLIHSWAFSYSEIYEQAFKAIAEAREQHEPR